MQPEDAEGVATVIRLAFATVEAPLDPAPSALRETAASVLEQFARGGGAVWEESTLAGCVLWRVQDAGLYLCRLAVHPGYRRRGLGRRLIAAAEAEARAIGQARIHLSVRLPLTGNRRLFASAGFRETTLQTHAGYGAPTSIDAEKLL